MKSRSAIGSTRALKQRQIDRQTGGYYRVRWKIGFEKIDRGDNGQTDKWTDMCAKERTEYTEVHRQKNERINNWKGRQTYEYADEMTDERGEEIDDD